MVVVQRELAAESLKGQVFLDDLQPGTRLMGGKFVCQDFLGADGFGITYLAKDGKDKVVVLKECFPGAFCRRQGVSVEPRHPGHEAEVKAIVRLFAQEARKLSQLNHPNIVRTRGVFKENNTAYLAMDFVDGRDLMEILEDDPGQLSPDQIKKYLEKMLDAVGYVHEKGILHRDISPRNMIISQDDEPVLLDFGAAREQATKTSRILSVLRVVKDGYAPQESYLSGSEQGPSCDLYSLAASYYHVITNQVPPGSQQRLAARASDQSDPYVPLEKLTTNFDARFCAAVDKAMSIMPGDRFQSAEEWREALRPGAVKAPEIEAPSKEETAPVVKVRIEPRRVYPQDDVRELEDEPVVDDMVEVATTDMQDIELDQGFVVGREEPEGMRSSDGFAILRRASAAIAFLAGITLSAYSLVPSKSESVQVLAQAPVLVEVAITDEGDPPQIASFGSAINVQSPAFWVAQFEAEMHGVSAAARTAPVFAPDRADSARASTRPTEQLATFQVFPVNPRLDLLGEVAVITDTIETYERTVPIGHGGEVATEFQSPVASDIAIAAAQPVDFFAPPVPTNFNASLPRWAEVANVNSSREAPILAELEPVEQANTKRVVQTINLPNGLGFQSDLEDGAWITRVTQTNGEFGLVEGDVMIGLVRTSQRIDGPDSLSQIVEAELADGRSVVAVAVERNGQIWVETFSIVAP